MPSNAPIFPDGLANPAVTIVNADASALKTILTGAATGTKLESLSLCTDDSARVLQFIMTIGGIDYNIGEYSLAATAGTDGATAAGNPITNASLMPWIRLDSAGRPYIYVASTNILKVKSKTTVTAAKTIWIVGQAGTFS